ncbi:ATP-dependent helicase [Aliiglaciecola sp. 2_MG-2023]|uniref:ATP-dependent helicase n=1 Tax=unclassified Aliiglaciecola TaxID=2593648 RepID=UPI0026E43929|nr:MULTISPECIES: ATP-dependent helicase [unclassified Aliiglaciecola]MDO6710346.1 ATP-dependent helicase [Aliiglaciecola sp. 2_MG-2023]MDO6751493.1 ATP-dependent helicase [Aliiglaciecola sp. 1_MG-2023]
MDKSNQIRRIASEAVDVLEIVATTAKKLAEQSQVSSGHGQLASINSFNDTNAVDSMSDIAQTVQQGYQSLQNEPAIARVTYGNGEQTRTLYIARKSSIKLEGDTTLASYDSPLGHLASLQVGDEAIINVGGKLQVLEVLETLTLKPKKIEQGWDSYFSIYTQEDEETVTIAPSLRKLFHREVDLSDESFLDELLSGDAPTDYSEGVKHQVRSAMSLRDQPILDKFQSEIFRLPLDSQLIILGPPGTGKTTTLIKRLGQKLNIEYLEHSEQQKIKNSHSGESGHKTSWLMFTPTDLLKHYLKEAFAKEQVPASSEQIKTWENYSSHLGRNVLSILQSSGSGGFVKKAVQHLNANTSSNLPSLYDEFIKFHKLSMINELKASIEQLGELESAQLTSINQGLSSIKQSIVEGNLIEFYRKLEQYQNEIQNLIKDIKADAEKQLRGALAYQVNSNKSFITELVDVITEWKKSKLTETVDEEDDDEDEDEEQIVTPQQQAFSEYKKSLNALARAKYLKRSLPKNSLSTAIVKWLDNRLPEVDKIKALGGLAIQMRELRKFKNAEIKYVKNISKSYRAFRKSDEQFKKWYESSPAKPNHIEQSELDILILAKLRVARELLKERFIQQKLDQGGYNQLILINETFKNQVLVDEATDFSPIQLANMEALTMPSIGSFFACGDFNQRITELGTKSASQLNWISPKLSTESINIVYRQSKLLNDFAKELLTEMDGDIEYSGELPKNSNHQGVMPVLLENASDNGQIVIWLKDRIIEVEQEVDVLPTIAILVNHENEVKPLADALTEELEDFNIRAVACSDGQSLGEGNDVRVFDVQHIKGLEFEAVFFVGADVLAENIPELFDKYLYVGATRAATFFGITCHNTAPKLINNLRSSFQESWA